MFVQRVFLCARRIVGDHRHSAFRGNDVAQMIAVIGGICHDNFGGQPLDQGIGLRRIALLAWGKREADRAAETTDRQVDFGAQAAARATKGLIFSPFFAPAAC